MKKLLTSSFLAVAMLSSQASAGVLDEFKADLKQLVSTFPAHEADGYRDTGCDIDEQVAITNAAGEVLYYNNPTCPVVGGSAAPLDALAAAFPAPVVEEEEEEVDPKPGHGHGHGPKKDGGKKK